MFMKVGDIIRLNGDTGYLGRYANSQVEVIGFSLNSDIIKVKAFDGYKFDVLRYHVDLPTFSKCECGAESVGSEFHATWCDLFRSPWGD